jgi:hypothetical protein
MDCVPCECAEVVVDIHLSLVVVAPSLTLLLTYQMELVACDHGPSEGSQALCLESEGLQVVPWFVQVRDFWQEQMT